MKYVLTPRSSEVRDELTFNASDNDDNPESPTMFAIKMDQMVNKNDLPSHSLLSPKK